MDAHALPQPVLLYDQPFAPNPRRVNMFLAEKGVDIPRHEMNLIAGDHKAEAYLAKTGVPLVPALELSDGTVLTETQAICRYIEALHPEPNMLGRDPLEEAQIDMWQRRLEFGLFASVAACFRHTNPKLGVLEDQVPEWGEINRGRIDVHLRRLNDRLAGRDWVAADRFTIADITGFLATGFRRIIRHEMPPGMDHVEAWMARIAARPSTAALPS